MRTTFRGAAYALLSALAFGISPPLIARFGGAAGPWQSAALLYCGAALVALTSLRAPARERRISTSDGTRIGLAAILGATLAPAAFVWGIRQGGALGASLALTLESAFTIAIARLVFHEHLGRRVIAAAVLIAAGATTLLFGAPAGPAGALGLAAVAFATLLWAIDNAVTGTVADADPGAVVFAKCAAGASGSALLALATREPFPGAAPALALLATGAVGYGASLLWYVRAQRSFGVARTASVFAAAPFVGAALALAFGERGGGIAFACGAAAIGVGVWLHVSEKHEHVHRHAPLEHEHAHRHDDEHHADHEHAATIAGSHNHPHTHRMLVHAHPHAPDLHHGHGHE
ncbi:MAG TPA: EamA family transporter [Candidatus Acidoferrum sp.]|nr:EamA family transporter [Candidatus Acidoferrum sp.]